MIGVFSLTRLCNNNYDVGVSGIIGCHPFDTVKVGIPNLATTIIHVLTVSVSASSTSR